MHNWYYGILATMKVIPKLLPSCVELPSVEEISARLANRACEIVAIYGQKEDVTKNAIKLYRALIVGSPVRHPKGRATMAPHSSHDRQSGESTSSSSSRRPMIDHRSDDDKCIGCDIRRIKCVLIGDGAVGKTSAVVSYTTNGFPQEYVPTAFDNYNVMVTVDNQPIRVQLCDTAGQDDFDSLRPLCYPDTDVFLLCFSVASPTSFVNVRDKWISELWTHCGRGRVPIILVGTQCDLRSDIKVLIELAAYGERPVDKQNAEKLARQLDAVIYIEISSLTQQNLKEVFDTAILVSLQRQKQKQQFISNNNNNNSDGQQRIIGGGLNGQPPRPSLDFDQSRICKPKKKGWTKLCCMS